MPIRGAQANSSEDYPARELEARKIKEQTNFTGFIAQDVEKAAKEINYDFSGVDAAKNDHEGTCTVCF